jgi:hypothetical protein
VVVWANWYSRRLKYEYSGRIGDSETGRRQGEGERERGRERERERERESISPRKTHCPLICSRVRNLPSLIFLNKELRNYSYKVKQKQNKNSK